MNAKVKAIRAVIGHIPNAWVRDWGDGTASVGIASAMSRRVARDPKPAADALMEAGYKVSMSGAPGTSGERIITVYF